MTRVVYTPKAPWISASHLAQFLMREGFSASLKGFQDFQSRFAKDPEVFWTLALKDINLKFQKFPSKILYEGLPWPCWAKDAELSVVENCIDRHLKTSAAKTALIFETDEGGDFDSYSFEELARASSEIAERLKKSGFQRGDAAALLMPMCLEMVASFFGVLRAGGIVIPIFSGYGPSAISARLNDAKARFVLVSPEITRRGKPVAVLQTLKEVLSEVSHSVTVLEISKDFSRKREFSKTYILPPVATKAEDVVMYLYTSGTTGNPKACVHTAFGVMATTGKELRYGFDVKSEDRFFWYTDIGWMMGPWELFGVLQYGATVVLYEGVPDFPTPARIWEIIDRHQVTHLGISPTAIRVLKKAGDDYLKTTTRSSLRILGSTGEPWDEESWIWYFEKVGQSRCPIINISGGTEIMGCHLMPSVFHPLTPTTLGGPALGVQAEVWTEEGKSLTEGLGHLVCRSALPSMTKGFLHNPKKYLQTYFEKFGEQTWYHGDWVLIDEEGFWYLKGRSDDTIKVAGKRVGPNEYESALMEDPRVAEAAAVGLPDDVKGEKVFCAVVLKRREDESEELRNALLQLTSKKMGRPLMADRVVFVDALPKTRSGKILRGIIRKIVLGEKTFDASAADNTQSLEAIQNRR